MDDVGSMIGDVASGIMGMESTNATNAMNLEMQQDEEAYNTEMSDTAYQRGMADMKAAGLNPMLAYMQGGDSAPTAPVYTLQSPLGALADSASNLGDDITNSIKDTAQNNQTRQQTETEKGRTKSSDAKGAVDQATVIPDIKKHVADAASATASAQVDMATRKSAIAGSASDAQNKYNAARQSKVEADVSEAGSSARQKTAKVDPYLNTFGKAISGAASATEAGAAIQAVRTYGHTRYNPKTTGTFDKRTGEINE